MYLKLDLLGAVFWCSWLVHAAEPPLITLALDTTRTYQTIHGFGFSEAFQRAHAIQNLPEPHRSEVLDLLFHPTRGAGFNILRLGLGSSRNSSGDWMNSPQPTLSSEFKWDGKDSGQVWVAQQAQKYGVDNFYANAWSAPGYMKTNGRDDQGGYLCGVNGTTGDANCDGSYVQAYAEYLARYVAAWREVARVPVRWVGFINEPNLVKPYATMLADGYQAAEMSFALRVALSGLNMSEVGIACCEAQGWSLAREIHDEFRAAGAEDTLSFVGAHAYKGNPAAPDGPLNTTLPVWITENSPIMERLGMTQSWHTWGAENEGLSWALNIHNALAVGNVSAYVYWIGVGQSSAEAPFIVAPNRRKNGTRDSFWSLNGPGVELEPLSAGELPYKIGATYWASAHYSRFVRPGAVRFEVDIQSDTDQATIRATAFENLDGTFVVQVINNTDQDVEVAVQLPELPVTTLTCQAETWVTDIERRMELVKKETVPVRRPFDAMLPGRSLSTWVIRCADS